MEVEKPKNILGRIRTENDKVSTKRKIAYSIIILVFGVCMGLGSKILDETAVNDITNFLGRFAIWIFIAVCISVYSSCAKRAALNVGLFFAGMVGSYYLYSAFAAGFFPRNYALIWFGIAAVSPLLAFICWYAKGEGWAAVTISGIIIGVLLSQAILFFQGIRVTHITEVIVWAASLWVLRRKPKEFAAMMAISFAAAIIVQIFFPYWD